MKQDTGSGKIQAAFSYAGSKPDPELLSWIEAGMVHGIVLFADNCRSLSALKAAIEMLRGRCPYDLRIMIDEEGGRVRRLPPAVSPMAALPYYGERDDIAGVLHGYRGVARFLHSLDIDTLLAPVVDIQTDRNIWEADRTFSQEPTAVASFAAEAVRVIQDQGIDACAKHFPGLGGVGRDLHHHPDSVDATRDLLINQDCAPFVAAIRSGVNTVMVSHALYSELDAQNPAVLSTRIVTDLLRHQFGFSGTVLTDDLAMQAVSHMGPIERVLDRAEQAGCDMALVCHDRALQRRVVQHMLS